MSSAAEFNPAGNAAAAAAAEAPSPGAGGLAKTGRGLGADPGELDPCEPQVTHGAAPGYKSA